MITCDTPTTSLRTCKHSPRYAYLRNGRAVYRVCAQHYRSKGHARLLLPRPWEVDAVLDMASGMITNTRKDDGA